MAEPLSGKVAIITGGASGIGRATVDRFINAGAHVCVGDIRDEAAPELNASYGERVQYQHADVSVDSDVAELVSATVARFGRLDVMFNNAAASGERAPLIDLSADAFDRALTLIARSVWSGHKYAARQFRVQGTGGSIISTTSIAGLQGGYGGAAYTIGKHAVIGVVRAATKELAPLGIRSNAIAPGVIYTGATARSYGFDGAREELFNARVLERAGPEQPIGRLGAPTEVADVALFLASDASSFMTGAVLAVDGGSTAVGSNRYADIAAAVASELRQMDDDQLLIATAASRQVEERRPA
jgi:NAD(P)-dependent dehydrogenase (short-subunit alcohol dehydrogenase family)